MSLDSLFVDDAVEAFTRHFATPVPPILAMGCAQATVHEEIFVK